MGGRRLVSVAVAAFACAFAWAIPAQATFHEISIREVYPGSVLAPDSDYVVLQMYVGGQQFVNGQSLRAYNAGGTVVGTFTFGANVGKGESQRTILIGDDGVDDAFGVTPDLVNASFSLDPAGGAVCWASTIDCVSWGAFNGSTPSAAGAPADGLSGIPNGMALRRSTAPGCPTLLEGGDDSNDSATDLVDATPQPRNNNSAIVEQTCTGPTTTIDGKPANPTKETAAAFAYQASAAGASFECKLDAGVFAPCDTDGVEYAGPLGDGNHTFQVRAKSAGGTLGPAASYTWRVDTVVPTTTIDTHPTDPGPSNGNTFTFHASESGVAFQCSLALGAAADSYSPCSSGKTYNGLTNGSYTFKVKGTDAATNAGVPASFVWTVDSSVDASPPDTVIDSAPPEPSQSADAAFTYHATEPGSSFECKLDGAAFAPCPGTGISYSGLANGSHAFQVRATDPSDNTDPTPAGRTFSVAVPAPVTQGPPMSAPSAPTADAPVQPRKKRRARKRCRAAKRGHAAHSHAHAHHRKGKGRSCKRRKRGGGASASSFHVVMVRELYPGSSAAPGAEYVVLQMYASGQEFVKGHRIELFDESGASLGTVTFDADVARGTTQSTILLATPEAESQFGVVADKGFAADKLDPAGGAVCWEELDCVAWGGSSGGGDSPSGAPADPGGIPDGMALRRTIAPGCPTLLEGGDDSDNSAADFADAFPAPRPNSVPPSEQACAAQGGSAGGPTVGKGGEERPQTTLRRRPAKSSRDRTPTFAFTANRRGVVFLCKLDRRPFKRCRSPYTSARLSPGGHVFRVKARVPGGAVDRSPAIWHFEIVSGG